MKSSYEKCPSISGSLCLLYGLTVLDSKNAAIDADFASRPDNTIQVIAESKAAAHVSLRLELNETEELVDYSFVMLVDVQWLI